MTTLYSIAEQFWRQRFPNPSDETSVRLEEVIATAKSEYAYQLWVKAMAEKKANGIYEVPSYLLSEAEIDVVNREADLSHISPLKSLDNDEWIQSLGDLDCGCTYVRTTPRLIRLLCDDNNLGSDTRRYVVIGNKIKFIDGAHKAKLPIVYANSGEDIEEEMPIDDAMGGMLRRGLIEIYGGGIGLEDKVNDSNPNTEQ